MVAAAVNPRGVEQGESAAVELQPHSRSGDSMGLCALLPRMRQKSDILQARYCKSIWRPCGTSPSFPGLQTYRDWNTSRLHILYSCISPRAFPEITILPEATKCWDHLGLLITPVTLNFRLKTVYSCVSVLQKILNTPNNSRIHAWK